MRFRLLPCGSQAILIECTDLDEVRAADAALRTITEGIDELVPAARTLLVRARRGADLAALRSVVTERLNSAKPVADDETAELVEIDVRYDGPDLAEVAAITGLTTDEVIAAHTERAWLVGFSGFAPGFGYLVDGDPRLEVPRRSSPRTVVPAGAVGLAGRFSGIYPRASPGGWQLIGRTDATLFDPDRDPPALLRPGVQVRFRAVKGAPAAPVWRPRGDRAEDRPAGRSLRVERLGLPVLVQDSGRTGHARLGISPSGAADRAGYELGARLLGHEADEAALEITLGELAVRAQGTCTVALTGADTAARLDGRAAPHATPFVMADGQLLELGVPARGLRTYLSVRGGVDVPPVLGSRSSDVLSGLGPPPVQPGDVLPIGTPAAGWRPLVDIAAVPPPSEGELVLEALTGPRHDWFTNPGQLAGPWHVSADSNRVGVRLEGTPLQRTTPGRELPSEAVVSGSVQIPPSGQPVVFLADHPVTGGYPVVAVLTPASVALLAQARPGQSIRVRVAAPG